MYLRTRHPEQDSGDREIKRRMIAAQRAACEQAAEALKAKIIREYVEYGGTDGIDKRSELRLLLDELRALRDVRYVIVTHIDRLARTVTDWAAIRFELEAVGAELITAANVMHTENRQEVTI